MLMQLFLFCVLLEWSSESTSFLLPRKRSVLCGSWSPRSLPWRRSESNCRQSARSRSSRGPSWSWRPRTCRTSWQATANRGYGSFPSASHCTRDAGAETVQHSRLSQGANAHLGLEFTIYMYICMYVCMYYTQTLAEELHFTETFCFFHTNFSKLLKKTNKKKVQLVFTLFPPQDSGPTRLSHTAQ